MSDTNLLLDARDELSRKYQPASLCLRELLQQHVGLNVSALVFDELWWGLFKLSYRLLTGQELTGREYKHNLEVWQKNWPTLRRITDEILEWGGINVLESSSMDLVRAAGGLMDANALAPRDAFHLAFVIRYDIPALVTADRDSDAVRLPGGRNLTIVKF